jgi:nicotinate-nucleotide adenylyltransferase
LRGSGEKIRRLGIFGATFDPPHYGHLIAVQFVLEALKLDQVLMIPAGQNPLKQAASSTAPEIRLRMLKAAAKNRPGIKISQIELERAGISYTIETIEIIRSIYNPEQTEFFLLLGADAGLEFEKWRDYQRIEKLCRIAVFNRPGFNLDEALGKFTSPVISVRIPQIEISSTMIRQRVMEGKSIDFLTPPSVVRIIKSLRLYQNE